MKHPINAVTGYGFFAHATRLPISLAWEAFGSSNGDPTREGFLNRIAEFRRETPAETLLGDRELTCLILREVHFLPENQWVRWGEDKEWSRNIVAFKRYDLAVGPGLALAELLKNGQPAELVSAYELVREDERLRAQTSSAVREGQGAFRVRILDAYGRRCAITGERSLPVLDAAHIQPYLGPASNHVQNGLSMRTDIHRLYDAGYVTVTPEYRFEVSRRLKDDYENGKIYYELEGSRLVVVPSDAGAHPSREALEWHATEVFR